MNASDTAALHPSPITHHPPTSTYRVQLNAGFTFADARAVVPYLAELGFSHLYLSPVLQAAPGSMHGYDVVDHSRVSDDLGGRAGLEALAAVAQRTAASNSRRPSMFNRAKVSSPGKNPTRRAGAWLAGHRPEPSRGSPPKEHL